MFFRVRKPALKKVRKPALSLGIALIFFLFVCQAVNASSPKSEGKIAWSGAAPTLRQAEKEIVALEAGRPIQRQLAGGTTHTYQVAVAAGQYLHLTVDQRGIDVVVVLIHPDGRQLIEVDSPNGTQGPEPLSLLADESGAYRLQVRSLEKDAPAGLYEIKIDELRYATEKDRARVRAEKLLAEGEQLRLLQTAESLGRAIEKYQEALPVWRLAGDVAAEANTWRRLGYAYYAQGNRVKEIECYAQALPLLRSTGAQADEAELLNLAGLAYFLLGETRQALDDYNQALNLWRTLGDQDSQASALNNIGRVYDDTGERQKALEYYDQALPLYRAAGNRRGEAIVLSNIGLIYSKLGDYQKGITYYNEALAIQKAINDGRGQATTLLNIGAALYQSGQGRQALDYYNQALPIQHLLNDFQGEATTLNNLGDVYVSLGEEDKALEALSRSLPLRQQIGDRQGEAYGLNNLSKLYLLRSDFGKALELSNRALLLARATGDPDLEAITLYLLSVANRRLGNFAKARAEIEGAIKLVETVRLNVDSPELRASYLASVQTYYTSYINLLMQMDASNPKAGYEAAALQISERARARSLLGLLAEVRADLRQGVDPELLERERAAVNRLNSKASEQTRLLARKPSPSQAEAISREVDLLAAELQRVEAQIRTRSPRYAALTQPQPLTLEELQQQVLDPETLLLEFALAEQQSYLWVISKEKMESYRLPGKPLIEKAARQVIETMAKFQPLDGEQINQYRERTTTLETEYYQAAGRLSQMILGPAAARLGNKRLAIVADGILQYISFAALPAPAPEGKLQATEKEAELAAHATPLILSNEIVNLPSGSVLAVLRREIVSRRPAPRLIAVLADPVYSANDARIKSKAPESAAPAERQSLTRGLAQALREARALDAGGNLPRLFYSRQEAESILALIPQAEQLKALDFKANLATAKDPSLSQYRIVHFATHGLLSSDHPELSSIVLSLVNERGEPQEGLLRLNEIFNLNLPAELVVLSACRTGLGREIRGEGLVGLTRGFMYAGAARVIASLWKVKDDATRELMRRFYQKLLQEKLRPAAALRAAQLEMWNSKRWKSPDNWAAFVLQGEWK